MPPLNLFMIRDLLKYIWGDNAGTVYLAAQGPNKDTDPFIPMSFKYPEEFNQVIRRIEVENKHNSVYFCPALFSPTASSRKREHVKSSSVVWVDKDSGDLSDIEPKPSLCWQTSEGKYQAIWKLSDGEIEPEVTQIINKRMITKCNGDKGTWEINRFLRVPTTTNFKYKPPFRGILIEKDGPTYSVNDFLKAEVDAQVESAKELLDITDVPKKVPAYAEAVTTYGKKIPQRAWDLLNEQPKKGERSNKIWDLEGILMRAGVPLEYVFAIAKGSVWNKYDDGRDNPDLQIWKEIQKQAKEKNVFTPEAAMEELPWVDFDSLLWYAEKPTWLVEDIWMAKNVGWIAGEGKSYKTILSLDLALSIASGTPFLDKYEVKDPGPVLMIQEEDPTWRVAHRIQAMAQHKGLYSSGISEDDDGYVIQLKDTNIPLYVSIGGRLTFEDEDKMLALERAIQSKRPKLVVLDPMFMLSAGMDEFKAGEMAFILNTLKQWRNDYDCAISIVHHFRKSTGADTQKLYGSMALYAWSENSLLVQRESRDCNIISIRKDIKDAPSDDKLSIEFLNIDEEYNFVVPDIQKRKDEISPIFSILTETGKVMTIPEIQEETGLAYSTVRRHLVDLEDEGYVTTERKGKGGPLRVGATEFGKAKFFGGGLD